MKRLFRNNGLTITFMALFALSFAGQGFAGLRYTNSERMEHHEPPVGLFEYLGSGEFWSAAGENWESEFLQMFFFVWMSSFLYQKGSPESNDPDQPEHDPAGGPESKGVNTRSPWPVHRGGWILKLYSHSLSLAFLALFAASFLVHAVNGARQFSEERARVGSPAITMLEYLATPRMWFESLQNWQSEFLSVAAMVFLSVYLRERGSPESKRVAASRDEHE